MSEQRPPTDISGALPPEAAVQVDLAPVHTRAPRQFLASDMVVHPRRWWHQPTNLALVLVLLTGAGAMGGYIAGQTIATPRALAAMQDTNNRLSAATAVLQMERTKRQESQEKLEAVVQEVVRLRTELEAAEARARGGAARARPAAATPATVPSTVPSRPESRAEPLSSPMAEPRPEPRPEPAKSEAPRPEPAKEGGTQ